MSSGGYWGGLAFFAASVGGPLVAAWLIADRRLPELAGSMRWLAWGLVATAAVLATHLLPAALGILSRETAAVAGLLIGGVAACVPAKPRGPEVGYRPPAAEASEAGRWIARFAVLAFAIWLVLVALDQRTSPPLGFDAASAYLPTAANWLQEGTIWGLSDWLPNFFFGAAPGNGTVVLLATMLPWDNDFLTHFAIFPFIVMTAVAVHALAREAGAPRSVAAAVGVMLTAAPVIVMPALDDALLDPVLYATFACGLLFLLRHHRTGETSDLVLAGIGLGIAFGTKFYGFTAVPIVVVIWLLSRLLARVPFRVVARQAGVVVAAIALLGGIWVARNWAETGNPAFPVQIEVAGVELFDAPDDPLRDQLGATLTDYADDPSVWTGELRRQFRIAVGIPLVLLAAAVAIAAGLLIRRRGFGIREDTDNLAAVGVITALALALSYALTPYSATGEPGNPFIAAANVRYGIPALIAAAGVAGWLSGRLGRHGPVICCALATVGLFDALRIGVTTPRSTVYAAFALAAVAVGVAWALRERRSRRPDARDRSLRLPRVAVAGGAVLVAVLLGAWVERGYNDVSYRGQDPALDWVLANAAEDTRVGLAGTWTDQGVAPIYPAFGPRLRNEVDYLGPVEDGLLGTYTAPAPFLSAVEEGGFEVLVIGRAPSFTASAAGAELPPAGAVVSEQRWAKSAGYRVVAESERFVAMARGT